MKKKTARMPIRVVFYRDESDRSVWVAHCLEFDLMGHGPSQRDALVLLNDAIALQVKHTIQSGNIENLFSPAPAEYQLMYARGRNVAKGRLEVKIAVHDEDFEIGKMDAREYDEESDRELALV